MLLASIAKSFLKPVKDFLVVRLLRRPKLVPFVRAKGNVIPRYDVFIQQLLLTFGPCNNQIHRSW